MRLTKQAKQEITERIRRSAAEEMRKSGSEHVNLDAVMAGAGLTRGAFYAHFASKADLLAAVMRHEHPLLAMLARREGPESSDLKAQMLALFRDYLEPAHHAQIYAGCTLASLTADAARAPEPVREAFGAAFSAILAEMARGQASDPQAYAAPLVLASGAVNTAQALPEGAARDGLLRAAQAQVQDLLARLD